MGRVAYLSNILVRAFFIFVALVLVFRSWLWSFVLAVVINIIYELTAGRKFWQAWKNTPKKSRRHWKVVLRDLWRRMFARERTKGLVFVGFILLLSSYVVKFQVYYVIIACLVFTLAAISRFAPPQKNDIMKHESQRDTQSSTTNCPPPATE